MEKETSCINSKAVLDYFVANHYGNLSVLIEKLHPEIDALSDPIGFLRDPNNWISCDVISKLYQRAIRFLNDDMAPYKIAKFSVENATLGYALRLLARGFWSSKMLLIHVQKVNEKFNRNKRVELVELKKSEAVLRLHWDPNMKVSKSICLNNQGVYTYMPLLWNGRPCTLIENCCYFDGAPYCEYHLKWPRRNRLNEIIARFYTSKSLLMDFIEEIEQDKKIIEQKYEEVNHLNRTLNRKINQMKALQETGKAILTILDLKRLLSVIMNILYSQCRISRAVVMLVNEKKETLEYAHSVGSENEVPETVKRYSVPLDRHTNIMARVAHTGCPEYIQDVKASALKQDNVLISHGKPTSIFAVPLVTHNTLIGVIAAGAIDKNGIPAENREMLKIFASQIAIAIENARLYKNMQEKIKELKRSHALLSRSERFSFLGNLAARLAHEIKNPMTAIGTFIQLLPNKFDDREFREIFYKIASEETARVNMLITELLDLVKARESFFEAGDLHALIDKMTLLVSPQSHLKRIRIIRRLDSNIKQVWMDTEKIKQAILNLLLNAVDFSPEGGQIELKTGFCSQNKEPRHIYIRIKDDGPGIPVSLVDNIFDPYFTTKHKNSMYNGTGLGLFIAHQNIQDHGGSIDVKNNTDQGTTFEVILPCLPFPPGTGPLCRLVDA